MIRYLLYFEDIPECRPVVEGIANSYFTGYTLRSGHIGFWQGERENSVILEILAEYSETAKIYRLAESIRLACKQTAVLVASSPVHVESVTAENSANLIAQYSGIAELERVAVS